MARLQTISFQQAPWWLRGIYRLAANEVKKLTGKAEIGDTLRLTAQRPRLLFGLLMMESSQAGAMLVPTKLKVLASLRVSTIVGCPY